MKITEIKNKETGEVYKTKDGETMKKVELEKGDIFICQKNSVFTNTKTVIKDGKNTKVENNKILVKFKDEPDKDYFVDLTPAQASTIKKKIENNDDITQFQMIAYEYISNYDGNTYIGVGKKSIQRKPISFDDLDEDDYINDQLDDINIE
jgi:hypothetical protein